MTSLSPDINALHLAYIDATGYELRLSGPDERRWYEASKFGITPDDVKLVVKARLRGIVTGDRKPASIYLRNLIGDEDMLAEFAMELAAIKATQRKRLYAPGKAEVLRVTGREDEPAGRPAISAQDVIRGLKEAAG